MNRRGIGLIACLLVGLCLALGQAALAEERALEQLLEIFEQRGLITREEAGKIKQTITEDQERLKQREMELDEREQELQQRERALEERAAAPETEHVGPAAKKEVPREAKKETGKGLPLEAGYEKGFYLRTPDEDTFSLYINGLLQFDYRYFDYDSDQDPAKDGFDIRRARLTFSGNVTRYLDYRFYYQFEGAAGRRLLDAYVDAHVSKFASIELGQFKAPFSLEWTTPAKDIFFAERSLGIGLTPLRDLGVMAHKSLWGDKFFYGAGIFNGNGLDDSERGDVDSPEFITRLVFAPFRNRNIPLGDNFQFGGSFSYNDADRNDVAIQAVTPGLTPFFDVASRAKFNIIRDADYRMRTAAELAWAYGPVALMGEYYKLFYKDVETSAERFNIDIKNYYASLIWMITGEKPIFRNGKMQPIEPLRDVWTEGWGAIGVGFRYNVFDSDDSVYDHLINAGDSVADATAYSFVVNWFLNPSARLLLDVTRINFDQPLLIDIDPLTGTAVLSDREDVVTARFQFQF